MLALASVKVRVAYRPSRQARGIFTETFAVPGALSVPVVARPTAMLPHGSCPGQARLAQISDRNRLTGRSRAADRRVGVLKLEGDKSSQTVFGGGGAFGQEAPMQTSRKSALFEVAAQCL